MINNQNDKKVKNPRESLVGFTKEYNKNERPPEESLLGQVVDKVKAGTKSVIDRVETTDKDLCTQYSKETEPIFCK